MAPSSRTPLLRRLVLACLGGVVLWSPASSALIVWEGQVVQEWPDRPAPLGLAPGVAAAEWPTGVYPNPKGEVWGLTIVVDFDDVSPAFTLEEVEAWLNLRGYDADGVNGSVRDYFWDNSRGQVDFQNEVVGFVRAAQPKSYYEGGSGYQRAGELVAELLEAIDDQVDFSRFDNDGDGRTEAISIVYAGPSETFAQGLWPHAGGLRETRDGVELTRYQMSQMGNSLGLYTIAHEVGHMLFGWPDLYGFGNYCIMGNASDMKNPVGINDFYRADQGWLPAIDIDESMNVRYRAVPDAGGYRYVNPDRPDEAFFWSNVQATNRWSSLRGSGLVLLHFDYAIRNNNPPNPLSLAVVQADGLRQLDETQWPSPGSDAEDFFHAETNTEFSTSTVPASLWNDGSESGLRIYEISASGPEMTFAVGHGTPDPGVAGAGGVGGVGGMPSSVAAATVTGGTATGGMATGGIATGGIATGGIATGGIATGGMATTDGVSMGAGGMASGSTAAQTLTTGASAMNTSSMSVASGSSVTTGAGGSANMAAMSGSAASTTLGGTPALTSGVTSEPILGPQATDSGCACRLQGPSSSSRGWLLGLLGLLVCSVAIRRRRKAQVGVRTDC